MVIEHFEQMEVVLEASNSSHLLDELRYTQPDLLLVGVKMPDLSSSELVKKIKAEYPSIKIILLGMQDDEPMMRQLVTAGANGYLRKNEETAAIESAIRSVMTHGYFIGDNTSQSISSNRQGSDRAGNAAAGPNSSTVFTPVEKEILSLICRNYTIDEIFKKLFIGPTTMESHRQNLLARSGASNTAGLIVFARENGLANDY